MDFYFFLKPMDHFHSDQVGFLKALVFLWLRKSQSLSLHFGYSLSPAMQKIPPSFHGCSCKVPRACDKFIWVLTYFCSSIEMVALAPDFELPVQQITDVCLVCLVQSECWTPTQLIICMLRRFSFPVLPFLISKYSNMLPIIFFLFSEESPWHILIADNYLKINLVQSAAVTRGKLP